MASLLIEYGQELIDEIRTEWFVEEYLAKKGRSTTAASSIHLEDEADLSVENRVTNESNNGFSFVNIHWASFSTGLSSVLAVVLVGLFIAECCYFRGRRQRQSCAWHTELLHTIAFSSRHVSSPTRSQSGA